MLGLSLVEIVSIVMIQFTDSKRLWNKQDSKVDTWISLRRGGEIDYAGELGCTGTITGGIT